jgi:hypothetical protein
VQGPVNLVSQLQSGDLEVIVDGTDFAEGRRRVVPEIKSPQRLTVISVRPPMVLIVVRKG